MADSTVEPTVFRDAGISYLRVPANNPRETAAFYQAVFGWTVDLDAPTRVSKTAPVM